MGDGWSCKVHTDMLPNCCHCSWAVIASYFADKTLVSQQIDSFNEFVNNTMQELVDEGQSLILDQNMQHTGKVGDVTVSLRLVPSLDHPWNADWNYDGTDRNATSCILVKSICQSRP